MTAEQILEKRQELNKLVNDIRAKIDTAEKEKRALTQEEKNSIAEMEKRADELDAQIELEQRQLDRERKMGEVDAKPIGEQRGEEPEDKSKEYRSAFGKYLRDGERARYTDAELRAIQADNEATGGMFMAPNQFVNEVIKAADDNLVIADLARVFNIGTAPGLGAPSLDSDIDDADWTPEIKTVTETGDPKFGKRELTAHQLTKLVKISNKLLSGSGINIEAFIQERLGYKFGIAQEKAFMTGDGAQKPLGLFVASDQGISTDYDVSTGNTATAITFDGLMEAKYSLKDVYQRRATWLFHRDAIKNIRKIKDGNGQYIWQAAVTGGNPAMILDTPYRTSEFVPNTFTSGEYVGIIGDFSFYWIIRRGVMAIQVLKELYALTNQTGYIGRLEVDAMPVLGEAFRRVKLVRV
ncbi:MAG TPA: phage major capsid protein [Bacillota bacterium]|nr:phage major capsid protein [Bacillota bacterium]